MIFYVSGVSNLKHYNYILEKYPNVYLLFSFAHHKVSKKIFELLKPWLNTDRVFIDSGAYSISKGTFDATVQDYCNFIKQYDIKIYAHLDDIVYAENNLVNLKIMEDAGLTPVPVYHWGHPREQLDYILERYDYLCYGGIAGSIGAKHFLPSTDELYSRYIAPEGGKVKYKVHGFGVAWDTAITRYPWYSIDNTKWLKVSAFGGVLICQGTKTKSVPVAHNSPSRRTKKHLLNLSKKEQEKIRQTIVEADFDYEQVIHDQVFRALFNLDQYMKSIDNMGEFDYEAVQWSQGLFY